MKKIFLLAFAAISPLVSFAQHNGMDNNNNKSYFGLRLSIDASIPTDVNYRINNLSLSTEMFGTGGGVSVGAIYNIPVVANLFIEPGVDLYYHTNSINIPNFFGDENASNTDYMSRSLRKFGMRIPVMIGYHYDFDSTLSAAFFTGPVLNIGFSNDYYLTTVETDDVKFHYSGSMYDTMKRANFSWRIGFGVNFFNNYYVGISGDIGMLNMMKNNSTKDHIKMHENGFQLTLGYNFK